MEEWTPRAQTNGGVCGTPFATPDGSGTAQLEGTGWPVDFSTEYTFYKKRSATGLNHLQPPDHFSDRTSYQRGYFISFLSSNSSSFIQLSRKYVTIVFSLQQWIPEVDSAPCQKFQIAGVIILFQGRCAKELLKWSKMMTFKIKLWLFTLCVWAVLTYSFYLWCFPYNFTHLQCGVCSGDSQAFLLLKAPVSWWLLGLLIQSIKTTATCVITRVELTKWGGAVPGGFWQSQLCLMPGRTWFSV